MKYSELEKILKTSTVPERPQTYWEAFPQKILAKARAGDGGKEPEWNSGNFVRSWFTPRRCFAGACLVLAGLIAGFSLGLRHGRLQPITDSQLVAALTYCREIQTLFPNQVRAIVLNRQSANLVLSEMPNVPDSPPLYLRITTPEECLNIVTFSGQQIRFGGELCEVLQDRQGAIILAGRQRVWVSDRLGDKTAKAGNISFVARPLEKML